MKFLGLILTFTFILPGRGFSQLPNRVDPVSNIKEIGLMETKQSEININPTFDLEKVLVAKQGDAYKARTTANSYGFLREKAGLDCAHNSKCSGPEGRSVANGVCQDFYEDFKGFSESDYLELGKIVNEEVKSSHGSTPSSSLLKNFYHITSAYKKSKCGDRRCFGEAVDKELFFNACEKVIDKSYFGNSVKLDNNYFTSFFQSSFENINIEPKEPAFFLEIDPGVTCDAYGSNCPFLTENYQKNCDLFGCSIMQEGAFDADSDLGQIVMQSMAGAREFAMAGNDDFCTGCMKDAYVKTGKSEKDFDRAKEGYESDVKNYLMGKSAGKEILDWVGDVESLYDLSFMAGRDARFAKRFLCEKELESIFNPGEQPCGTEGPRKEDYLKRLKSALSFINLPAGAQPSDFVKTIEDRIDSKGKGFLNGKSCREYNAFYRKYNFNSVDNREYKGALSFILENAEQNPEVSEALEKGQCGKGAGAEDFPSFFSKKMAETTVDKLSKSFKKLKEEGETEGLVAGEIAAKLAEEDPFLGDLLVGKNLDQKTAAHLQQLSQNIQKMFDNYKAAKEHKDLLKPTFGIALPETEPEKFREYLEKVYTDFYANTIQMAMKMDPAYKVNLGTWNAACELYDKANKESASIVGAIDSQSMEELERKALANADCSSALKPLQNQLCADPNLSPAGESGSNKVMFSKEDLDEAKNAVYQTLPFDDYIAANSAVCEMNGLKPNQFQARNLTELGAGVPFALSDFEMDLTIDILNAKKRGVLDPEKLAKLDRDLGAYKAMNNIRSNPPGSSCDSVLLKELVALQGVEPVKDLKLIKGGNRIEKAEDSLISMVNGEPHMWLDEVIVEAPSYGNVTQGIDLDRERFSSYERSKKRSNIITPAEAVTPSGSVERNVEPVAVGSGPARSIASSSPVEVAAIGGGQAASYNSTVGASGQSYYRHSSYEEKEDSFQDQASVSSNEESSEKILYNNGAGSSLSPELEKALQKALEGKSTEKELAEAKEKLREYENELENKIASEKETQKLLKELSEKVDKLEKANYVDKNGKKSAVQGRKEIDRMIAKPNTIYDPWKNNLSDASNYEQTKPRFSPDYHSASSSERLPFKDWQPKRQAAVSHAIPDSVRKMNTGINRSFLQNVSSKNVDSNYVRKYVEHLEANRGSLEHLVVFDQGELLKIRVPNPDRPEEYIERELSKAKAEDRELIELILGKYQADSVKSYVTYAQLSGQINDFEEILEVLKVQEAASLDEIEEMEQQKLETVSMQSLLSHMEQLNQMKQ